MLKSFLIIAFRHLSRHKVFSFINIFGLALGLASSFALVRFAGYEFSYDEFHTNASNIYRLTHTSYNNGALEYVEAVTWYGAAPAIKESFPEVANFVRLHRADGMVSYDGANGEFTSHHEKKSFYADSTFFTVFSFPLTSGDPQKVLRNPNSVLVSESTAKRYFGADNPIGKVISLTTDWAGGQYTVEGVFRDVPENSHVKFDFLFAIHNLLKNDQFANGAWYWNNFHTYLLLKPDANPVQLENKLPFIVKTHVGSELKKLKRDVKLSLQPLLDIHLQSKIGYELEEPGSLRMTTFLLVIAFIIVCVAWLNYVNLSTAKATERAREVGIRKAIGSKRILLVKQFLMESMVVTLMAVVLAGLLTVVLAPLFNSFVGKNLPLHLGAQHSFWIAAVGIVMLGTILSGLYPAFVLSSFQPLAVLKGRSLGGQKGRRLRQILVVFQFGASLILIIATMTVYRQLEYMRAQDLGMSISQKVVIRAPKIIHGGSYMNAIDLFREQLMTHPEMVSVSTSSEVPGKEIFWANYIRLANTPETDEKASEDYRSG